MPSRTAPRTATHEVENQAPPLVDYNLYQTDRCLAEAVRREGAGWAEARLSEFGAKAGSAEVIELGHLANRHVPELRTHDRFGHRVDEVAFHPAWHELMALGMEAEQHALPWNDPRPGAHVARAAVAFMMNQVESGVCCPLAMTLAGIPALRHQPEVAAEWEPRLRATRYDRRAIPAEQKTSATIIEMVHHTRLDVAICSAALMRQALAQASHHAAHRSAFQRRLAHDFDEARQDEGQRAFARLATADWKAAPNSWPSAWRWRCKGPCWYATATRGWPRPSACPAWAASGAPPTAPGPRDCHSGT